MLHRAVAIKMRPLIDRGSTKAAAVLACAALLACALGPSPARAATTWTVTGHGFGHGVGMSQYGAYGYALHDQDYRFILGHYYQGTTIGPAPQSRVRVLLTIAGGDVSFKKATSACGRTLNPTRSYRAHLNGNGVQLLSDAGRAVANCGAKLKAKGKGRVRIRGNGAYRGALVVVPTSSSSSLNVINALDIDKYVQGVIAGEMPSSWPVEALKVQAVAARSYALAGTVKGNGFDLYDDTRSQVYSGIGGETAATNRAARATKQEVVLFNGQVATTYYCASSGGQTENVEFGFGGGSPVPYLKAVDDPYDTTSPLHTWKRTYAQGQLQAKLGGYVKGGLQEIQITKTGVSPRIVSANVVGSAGTTKVSGSQLQSALGVYSTWMSFSKSG
jgi:stage II sporulation protein D